MYGTEEVREMKDKARLEEIIEKETKRVTDLQPNLELKMSIVRLLALQARLDYILYCDAAGVKTA
jgi:hypothetical protein